MKRAIVYRDQNGSKVFLYEKGNKKQLAKLLKEEIVVGGDMLDIRDLIGDWDFEDAVAIFNDRYKTNGEHLEIDVVVKGR